MNDRSKIRCNLQIYSAATKYSRSIRKKGLRCRCVVAAQGQESLSQPPVRGDGKGHHAKRYLEDDFTRAASGEQGEGKAGTSDGAQLNKRSKVNKYQQQKSRKQDRDRGRQSSQCQGGRPDVGCRCFNALFFSEANSPSGGNDWNGEFSPQAVIQAVHYKTTNLHTRDRIRVVWVMCLGGDGYPKSPLTESAEDRGRRAIAIQSPVSSERVT